MLNSYWRVTKYSCFFRIKTLSLLQNWKSSCNFDHDWINILCKFGTIFKFIIDTLEHLHKKIFFHLNLMSYLRSQYLPTGITIELSNGSCKIRCIMLNSYALSEFLCDNHTPCLHFSTPKQQTVLSIWFMPLPRYITLTFTYFPGIPRISSFKLI